MQSDHDRRVSIADAIAFAWSAPLRDLAQEIGSSDVGLKKALTRAGIPCPPQGYWNKLRAGKKVPAAAKAPARGIGETGTIISPGRSSKLPTAPLASHKGPFATAKVPESLDELYQRELHAIGRPVIATRMGRAHPAIQNLLDHDQRLKDKIASSLWYVGLYPMFESPFQRRRLRILNAIFLTLQRRGYESGAERRDYSESYVTTIGDTNVGLSLGKRGAPPRPYFDILLDNAEYPGPRAGRLDDEVQAVAVAVPPRFGG